MKSIFPLCLIVLSSTRLMAGSGPAAPAAGGRVVVSPEFINAWAERLRTNNPALGAARARADAAEAGVTAVPRWADPRVRVGGMAADDMMRREDGDLLYGVEQDLPLFGRPTAARRLAAAQLEVARADADFRFQMLRRDLAQAFFKAALADYVLELGEQDLAWIRVTLATAENRYQVGEGIQAQVLRMQNEEARRLDQLITDRRMRDQSRLVLNRLLGETNTVEWPILALPEPAGPVPFSDRLVQLSTRFEPRRQTLIRMLEEADRSVELARRTRHPEVSLGVEARHSSHNGEFRQAMVMLSMSVPWANPSRYRSEIRREEARRHAAALEVADYDLAIREELGKLTVAADAARREALLYREQIIPRSEQALASAEAAWTTSRATFLEVLEARRMLLDARLSYARAVTEQYIVLSELVLCCGLADLEALQMLNAAAPSGNQPSPSTPAQ